MRFSIAMVCFLILSTRVAATEDPMNGLTAEARCRFIFDVIRRSGAQPSTADLDGHIRLLSQFLEELQKKKAAYESGQSFVASGGTAASPVEPSPGGVTFRFNSIDGAPPLGSSPSAHYGVLIAKLKRAMEVPLKMPLRADEALFYSADPVVIQRLLSDSNPASFLATQRRRFLGLALGAITGGAVPAAYHLSATPLQRFDRQLIEQAGNEVAGTRERHLAWVKEFMQRHFVSHYDEQDRITKLKEHVVRLDDQLKYGNQPTWGSRRHEYLALTSSLYFSEVLDGLASAQPPSEIDLQIHYQKWREGLLKPDRPVFGTDYKSTRFRLPELELRHEVAEREWSRTGKIGTAAGGTSVGAGLGFGLAELLFRNRDRVREGATARAAHPELQPFLDVVTLGSQTQPVTYLFLSSATLEGRNTDLLLRVVRRAGTNPLVELAGIEYRSPIDYLYPSGTSLSGRLTFLRNNLVAERFGRTFGQDLAPLEQAMALAVEMKLSPTELTKFEAELATVRTKDDLKRLKYFLERLRPK